MDTSVEQHGGWPDGAQFLTDIEQVAAGVNKARYADYAAKYMGGDPFDGPYVYLGGGAGYRSKTIVTDQNQMAAILDKQFNRGSRPVPHKGEDPATRRLSTRPQGGQDRRQRIRGDGLVRDLRQGGHRMSDRILFSP